MQRIIQSIRAHFAAHLALALAVVGAAAACGDPYANKASVENSDQPFAVGALTGGDPSQPAGLSLANRITVRVDGSFQFDLAFDIAPDGRAVILPVSLVGTPISAPPAIGLQRVAGGYDSLKTAPKDGYFFDSTMTFTPTAAIAVQAQSSNCSLTLTPYTFAKVTIDSINKQTRTLYGRALINLNCGLRELTAGLPTY
jgi:hypothetical protein